MLKKVVFMAALRSLFSAVADWMSIIFSHMMWLVPRSSVSLVLGFRVRVTVSLV